ncbi:hypothetical protein ERO13_A01G084100v2 [Gossypium hirsutum]|uniref:Uncharacterized protein n=5 Tax=Gossypium TaxID=3633 RepID=A0ABR0QZP7_GOSAR|nr:hypothetical protein ES319_A01G084900v1 [Gossypium barbadense]KAG4213865.1 hypothetical protein ERO13_A01G084100v2 [Gossypium hirsutum]KAK5844797.1 hypothetical protein PVK06_000938 [Gossypium arboreum]TYH30414.1 hypothetical protein ES288_A01G093100v1 [Gossypium darwinii]TYI42456.1 hypothetical protein ES332_A01G100000v1 [Gossypium tomentosum]TYJ48782.1 hypothetical protein E1A91_A01G087800v1 [Gossypium mustelinum]
MGSKVSSLRVKNGSGLGESKKSTKPPERVEANINGSKGNKRDGYAKKALFYVKNMIERCACKLKIKKYIGKSGRSNSKKKSPMKRPCCACISSEKRTQLTNNLFKMKTFLLKVGGGHDHGGSKANNINGCNTSGGNHGKGDTDKKQM